MKLRMIVIASLFAAACGSKSKGTGGGGGTTPPGGGGGGETAGPLKPGEWEGMNHDARHDFMMKVVKPQMEEAFKGFDKERFADFGCRTCHGKGVDDHSFKMPNPDLPELSDDYFQAPPEEDKAILEFMMQTVKPHMATLLGLPEYGPDNPKGFGCAECHPWKQM